MKALLIMSILVGSFTGTSSQENRSIKISELVAISETSDFKALSDMVHRLAYVVVDSQFNHYTW